MVADDLRTPMHLSASEGKLEVIKFLVDEGKVNHSPVDRWGGRPRPEDPANIRIAPQRTVPEPAHLLLGTPLDDARRHNHANVVDYLVSRGAGQLAASIRAAGGSGRAGIDGPLPQRASAKKATAAAAAAVAGKGHGKGAAARPPASGRPEVGTPGWVRV